MFTRGCPHSATGLRVCLTAITQTERSDTDVRCVSEEKVDNSEESPLGISG